MRRIVCLSFNHRVTPLELREALAFPREVGVDMLRKLSDGELVEECILVSTCNRTELYAVASREDLSARELFPHLSRDLSIQMDDGVHVFSEGDAAVRHLFRVAGGLESQIIGESQILGQVKEARHWAEAAGSSSRVLHRLWDRALRVGKRIRTETALGDGALSASTAALELARKIFGSLQGKTIAVIGLGEIGELALQNLEGQATGPKLILNRSLERAEELAAVHGGEPRGLDRLEESLVEADVVLSSTGASEPIATYELMKRVRQKRRGVRPLLVVDLALPRDFEERAGGLDEIFLKNLDDLAEIVEQNLSHRLQELPIAEAIVKGECDNFLEWWQRLSLEPTILELRSQFEELRQEELAQLKGRVDEQTFLELEEFSRRLIKRLLHLPTENIKRHAGLRRQEAASLVHELLTQRVPHRREGEDSSGR